MNVTHVDDFVIVAFCRHRHRSLPPATAVNGTIRYRVEEHNLDKIYFRFMPHCYHYLVCHLCKPKKDFSFMMFDAYGKIDLKLNINSIFVRKFLIN